MGHDILAIWGRFLLIFALDKLYVRHIYFRSSWPTDLESVSRDAHLAMKVFTKFEVDTTTQNGDKVPKFVVFWTTSTIKDEKSAAKFHYTTRAQQ